MRKNLLDALFPRTRQNILAALLLSPERRWYLSDLAQHLKVTPSSLQREIASLTEAEVVCREADGKRVYFWANPDFPLLPELQSIFAKTVGLADRVWETLAPFGDEIETAFIFGSVARGEQTAQSDVDVLIVANVGMAKMALPLRDLERSLRLPINVTHYTSAEFWDKRRQKNHFLDTVLREQKIFLKGSEHELASTDGRQQGESAHHE